MSDVISHIRGSCSSKKKEFTSLLDESALGVIQPKLKKDLYYAAIKIGGNFEFSRNLKAHFSCVNAINFSNGDARLLVSGGDDRRVLIWDVYGDIENTKPKKCFKGHQGNIFGAIFDSTNNHILSCGNDRLIIYHDLERENGTSRIFLGHEDVVHSVSFDPFNDNIFLSASQDGTVKLWDVRCTSRCQGEIKSFSRMTHAQFNPTVERQFVTSNEDGDVLLKDTRTAFKSGETLLTTSTSKNYLLKYITTLSRNFRNVRPDVSSVTFNSTGTLLCTIINHYRPTLYNVSDEKPLCTFSSEYDSKAHTGYKNDCTYKQGYFGGPSGDYFLCGSDDFRVYVWKVPDMETMISERYEKSFTKNPDDETRDLFRDKIYFTDNGTIINPLSNPNPTYVLSGHRSIVNSAIWHPHVPLIFSSGVEKVIKVHSAFPFSDEDYSKVPHKPRSRFRRGEIVFHPNESEDNMEEDMSTLKFFDLMLMTEECDDPYWGNSWGSSDESDESDSSSISFSSCFFMHEYDDDIEDDEEDYDDDDEVNRESDDLEEFHNDHSEGNDHGISSENDDSEEMDTSDYIENACHGFALYSEDEDEDEDDGDNDGMNIEIKAYYNFL